MLSDVPAPPCKASTTISPASSPAISSRHACDDGAGRGGVEEAELVVGARAASLTVAIASTSAARRRLAEQRKILHRARGVRAPIGVGGNRLLAQRIAFYAHRHGGQPAAPQSARLIEWPGPSPIVRPSSSNRPITQKAHIPPPSSTQGLSG